jgi:hypothetical protein
MHLYYFSLIIDFFSSAAAISNLSLGTTTFFSPGLLGRGKSKKDGGGAVYRRLFMLPIGSANLLLLLVIMFSSLL